uniref:Transmembrane channel-like protein n=2 Tax=Leptobrachium leishanense TaxID=445787 RepID=A0A8C5QN94_9ANUR
MGDILAQGSPCNETLHAISLPIHWISNMSDSRDQLLFGKYYILLQDEAANTEPVNSPVQDPAKRSVNMSFNYNEGFVNSGYHDSETLELDRGQHGRPSYRQNSSFHHNSSGPPDGGYAGYLEDPSERRGGQRLMPINPVYQEFDYNQPIPRYQEPMNSNYESRINPVFESDMESPYIDQRNEKSPYMDSDLSEGDKNIRRRSKRQSALPMQILNTSNVAGAIPTEERHLQAENEKLIGKLSEMSEQDIGMEIQKLQISLNEKRGLRNKVIKVKARSSKGVSQTDCCSGCMYSMKKSYRGWRQFNSDFFTAFKLWHSTLKVIEGKFGTSILSYFIFLRWLLGFNIFSFLINFSFITIPQFFDLSPNNLSFSGLEIITGAGYFEETVLYYGYYSNSTIRKEAHLAPYNMQLAYIFTIGLYLGTCFFILLYSMGKSFRDNFINPSSFTGNAAKLLCSWDFSITNEKAVKLKKKYLSTQIKETMSEKLMEKLKLTMKQRVSRFCIHVLAWFLSCGIAAGCCAGVYYLCTNIDTQFSITEPLRKQAATLVVPVVVAFINLFVPLIYSLFGLVEKYKYPRHHTYVVIIRNVLLKISIIGILCYYWLHAVAESNRECWENYVGQDIYRLVVIDFIFVLLGSFFGEFIRRIIGTRCLKKWGKPEFDIARNVLDLIYAQTLAWIGIFFSPLLPIIQMIKLFIIFYLKRVSLMMNCTPPRRAWRASQMTTVFIFLLFFPSFAGVLCLIGVTVWRRQPSKLCGPFQELTTPYDSITNWVATIHVFNDAKWVVWIYNNLIQSVLFFYILTLIVLIISYLYLQIVRGRKTMVKHLLMQIGNEGNDKAFLLRELQKSHNSFTAPVIVPYEKLPAQASASQGTHDMNVINEMHSRLPSSGITGSTDARALAMMARHEAEREEQPPVNYGRHLRVNEENSDAADMVMRSRMEAESDSKQAHSSRPNSGVVAMSMQARKQAELEARGRPGSSEALAMAMRARQEAEMDR